MANDDLSQLIHIDIPVLVIMAIISAMLSNRQRRQMLPREPSFVRDIHRNAHMSRILDGGIHNCVEYIRMSKDTFLRTYIEGQPKAKDYLNKPIPFFDELRLIAGDDHATGDYARTIFDQFGGTPGEDESIPPPNAPLDGEPMDTGTQRREALRSSTNMTTARTTRRTRTNVENGLGENIGEKIGELAASINKTRKRTWKEKLTDVLWDMEGYSDDDMEMVYNKLIDNKKEAENFYLRKPSLRKKWVDNFIASMRNSSP